MNRTDDPMAVRAGKHYWESMWGASGLPRRVEPQSDTLRNYSYHEFHRYFSKWLPSRPGSRLIEFGCAQSVWLNYFARYFGYAVAGIDYSAVGCEKAREVLARAGVKGEIVHGDFTEPPRHLVESFDFGVSFGVAEHFENTAECVEVFGRFLKPGGQLVTVIPNLSGFMGQIQKRLDREIYDIHVPLSDLDLAESHRAAGFEICDYGYLVCSNFGVLAIGQSTPLKRLRQFVRLALMAFSASCWVVDRYLVRIPRSRFLSAYVVCIARKPGSPEEATGAAATG